MTVRPQRVHFDPKNKAHIESFKAFLSTGMWGEVKFECEAPFLSVPEYVMRKYATHMLKTTDAVAARADLNKKATVEVAPTSA